MEENEGLINNNPDGDKIIKYYLEATPDKDTYIGDVLIHEPCNYASNVAFYHAMMRICDYPFFHGSEEY